MKCFRLNGADSLQGRQFNHGGFLASAYIREPTPLSTPTDRQEQGILQLELSNSDETTLYPTLCQWERTNGGRGEAIQSDHQDQDINIFVRSRHRALSRYNPKLGWRLQQVEPPLHLHGAGRCPKKTRIVSGFAFLGEETPTLKFKFRRMPWCGTAAIRQFLTKVHAKLN